MGMTYEEATNHVHGLLTDLAPDLTVKDDDDVLADEMASPVLSEWVLIMNVVDLDGDGGVRIAVLASPNMLRSHVVGLLALARDNA
jgi:hypothetical protein